MIPFCSVNSGVHLTIEWLFGLLANTAFYFNFWADKNDLIENDIFPLFGLVRSQMSQYEECISFFFTYLEILLLITSEFLVAYRITLVPL